MTKTSSIYATLTFNSCIFVIVMILFEYFRTREPDIYEPKSRGLNPIAPKAKKGWFRWIYQVYIITDDELRELAGMDGYILVRFIYFCTKVCAICTTGAVILMPVYATSPGAYENTNMDTLTMGNLELNGNRLWVSLVFLYLFTIIFLYLIYKEYENFTIARIKYFQLSDKSIPLQIKYTIQVENIPSHYRTSSKLKEFFENIFPNEVMFAYVALSTPDLDRVVAERDIVIQKIENAMAIYSASRKRPVISFNNKYYSSSYCCRDANGENKIDEIDYLNKQLEDLCNAVLVLKESALTTENGGESLQRSFSSMNLDIKNKNNSKNNIFNKVGLTHIVEATGNGINFLVDMKDTILSRFVSATGFVTFKTRRAQCSASQVSIISQQFPMLSTCDAPAPTDIIWSNLTTSTEYTENICYTTSAVLYGGLFFWALALAFVSALSDLSSLEEYLPFVSNLSSTSKAILQGILPVLAMLVLSLILIFVIYFIASEVEKRKTCSEVQQEVFKWYFLYQLANIYILLLAGSVYGSLSDLISNPKGILNTIGESLPTVSVFFINFIITTWLSGVPLLLLRMYPSFLFEIYLVFYNPKRITRSMLKGGPYSPLFPYYMDYGTALPNFLYILCVVLLFWVIAPIIIIIATGFFASMYMTFKYQYVFIIVRAFENGGMFFYDLYKFSMIGLLVSTATMMLYMGIKQGIIQTPLLFPLPFIIIYVWRYTERQFYTISKNMPYDLAVKDDEYNNDYYNNNNEEINHTSTLLHDIFQDKFYMQPNIKEPAFKYPYPHRINDIPLIDDNGALNEIYVEEIPIGMIPEEYINNIIYQSPDIMLSSTTTTTTQIKLNETVSVLHKNNNSHDSDSNSDNSIHTVSNLI